MPAKVNLKKYLPVDGKWQFLPLLKVDGKPRPGTVVLKGKNKTGTDGTFYIEWRHDGKRHQQPVGSSSREALDRWRDKTLELGGDDVHSHPPDESFGSWAAQQVAGPTKPAVTIAEAITTYLAEVKATKSPGTLEAYTTDLRWFGANLKPKLVNLVDRSHIIGLLGSGRDQGLSQASINRRVMVGLTALRSAGATIVLKKRDWPPIPKRDVEIYEPAEIARFLAACDTRQRLLFLLFLATGFRAREIATLRWSEVNFRAREVSVVSRPEFKFTPKSYETRTVVIPTDLMKALKDLRKTVAGPLVFPSPEHPTRPDYGGSQPDAHHLEECKQIAFKAGLNCGHCKVESVRNVKRKRKGRSPEVVQLRATKSCKDSAVCERWYLHKWRHTYCTNMLQSGIDVRTLQVLAGHKDLATTEKYLKTLRLNDLKQKVESSFLRDYV